MNDFGIRFRFTDPERLASFRRLFGELKKDKDSGGFRDPDAWKALVPEELFSRFSWPTAEARNAYLASPPPIRIELPSHHFDAKWDFYRVFESVEESEYELLACEVVDAETAEVRINPRAYPYGGLGPFIALAKAYGFDVLGVNEYGKYETREELLAVRTKAVQAKLKPWWRFW